MTMQLPNDEQKTRVAYMVTWLSRKSGAPSYVSEALRIHLRDAQDPEAYERVTQALVAKGHLIPTRSGFFLTDEGVRAWSMIATSTSSVNSFDPELKVWANWILDPRELLECLSPDQWVHPERHVDPAVHKKAVKAGWVTFQGDIQRTRIYQITETGLAYRASLQQKVP
jgi:hypothetical protein